MFWDFYECLVTVPVWNLRFGDVQTVQDIFTMLMYMYFYNFSKNVIFTTKI